MQLQYQRQMQMTMQQQMRAQQALLQAQLRAAQAQVQQYQEQVMLVITGFVAWSFDTGLQCMVCPFMHCDYKLI